MKALLGRKIGMTQLYDENGKVIPVTVLDVSENFISKLLKNKEGELTHVEIGKDKQKSKNSYKADLGNYKDLSFVPKYKRAFKGLNDATSKEVGAELKADVFAVGDKVQVTSEVKGKGFTGVVKRWGFAGGPRTHGASDRERAPGSIGTRTIPGRVFKGKKMGGHHGTFTKTVKGLKIALVDLENNLVAVSGAIPGDNKSYVVIKSK